ncbi:MAG: hypothetical protein AABP62_17165 [Planctomycetota bacterium]
MHKFTMSLILSMVLLAGQAVFADITLVIHNDTAEPEVWLYMNCASSTGLTNIVNQKYAQPWKAIKPADMKPLTVTFKNIDSGNLSFGLMGPGSQGYLDSMQPLFNKPISPKSDAFFGFIEFTYLKTDTQATWDLSNVDSVGMLCGMTCPEFSGGKCCGYNTTSQTDFVTNILKASSLDDKSSAYMKCGPKLAYGKVLSPTLAPQAYHGVMARYLAQLEAKGINVVLSSDPLQNYSTCGQQIGGPGAVKFTGKFQPAAKVDDVDNVILKLAGQDADKTTIYLTTTALNGTSAFAADSDGGVYVYQGKTLVGNNVHLNWGTPCSDIPALPKPVPAALKTKLALQAQVSSIIRNLITAMNLGEIPYAKEGQTYDQNDPKTWVPAYTGEYSNLYNQYVVTHSNSYGMPYSDAAHSKVQYHSGGNSTVQLHLLGAKDPKTATYFNTNK